MSKRNACAVIVLWARCQYAFVPQSHRVKIPTRANAGDDDDPFAVPFWQQGGFGKGRTKRVTKETKPRKKKDAVPTSSSKKTPAPQRQGSAPGIDSIEMRMRSKWGGSTKGDDNEFYDNDDEGFEKEVAPERNVKKTEPKPGRFNVREPEASVGMEGERGLATSKLPKKERHEERGLAAKLPKKERGASTFLIRDPKTVVFAQRDTGTPGKPQPPAGGKRGANPPKPGGLFSSLDGAPSSAPSTTDSWGSSLWDDDDDAGELRRQKKLATSEKGKASQRSPKGGQRDQKYMGTPLTLDAVAERFHTRRDEEALALAQEGGAEGGDQAEKSGGASSSSTTTTSSLFVADDSSFADLLATCQTEARKTVLASSTRKKGSSQYTVQEDDTGGNDDDDDDDGDGKGGSGEEGGSGELSVLASGFEAALHRNILQELTSRAIGSGTRALELTSAATSFSIHLANRQEADSSEELDELDDELMASLKPTRVQAEAAAPIASGQDVLLCAPTGSGKTAAFLLPLLTRVAAEEEAQGAGGSGKWPKVLIIAPGRELASQTAAVCSRLLEGTDVRCQALIGGASVTRQLEALKKKKPQVVVGTPGRLTEVCFGLKKINLNSCVSVVVDEVDDMLSYPHRTDLNALLEATVGRGRAQLVLASATGGSQKTQAALTELLNAGNNADDDDDDAKEKKALTVCGVTKGGPLNSSPLPSTVEHGVLVLPPQKLLSGVRSLLNTDPFPEAAVVFVNDARRVDVVVSKLLEMNIIAAPLHGDSSKADRSEIMKRLNSGRIGLVVTTELAARGLDAPILTHVINLDLPTDATHYAHRAGRVGRAGRAGIVVSLATPKTAFVVKKFARDLGVAIPSVVVYANKLTLEPEDQGQQGVSIDVE